MFIDKCYQTSPSLQASVENNGLSIDISTKSRNAISIMRTLFNYHTIYGNNIIVSQETIALKSKVSLRDTNRQLGIWHKEGLIRKIRSQINNYDVCRYELTELAFKEKGRILACYKFFKNLAFAIGITFTPIQVGPRFGVQYCLKDINYTKTTEAQPEHLFLKVYSIYAEAQKRREYLPPHLYPTENRESRREKRLTTKKESKMEQPAWITPTLKSVTQTLNLTKWGQIRLSAYPDQALFHALTVFKASKSPKQDLFKWFGSVCNEWCKKNNKSPDWSLMHRLAVENSMPEDPTLILAAKPMDIPAAKPQQKASKQDELVALERAKSQQRIALDTPEDIAKQRAYLAGNPEWLDLGRRLMVDMSKWGIDRVEESIEQRVVTEVKDQIVCAQIAHDEVVWDNLTYSPVDGDEVFEEIYD